MATSVDGARRVSGSSTLPTTLYFNEVAEHDLLTAEEELGLCKAVDQGLAAARLLATLSEPGESPEVVSLALLVEEGVNASRTLVEANLRLVVWVARRYVGLGLPLLDLVQEGNIGLQQAVWHFDWRRGVRFGTYAYWWIRQGIVAGLRAQGRPIRLPADMQTSVVAVRRAEVALRDEYGREPTVAEIAQRVGVSEQVVDNVHLAVTPVVSLDSPFTRDSAYTWEEVIADETGHDSGPAQVMRDEMTQEVQTLLGGLDTYERNIVALRFGLDGRGPYSVREIADSLGVGRATIRESLDRAICKLRRHAAAHADMFEAV
jgi:RNA polymerase sigma factor (sigma-70 family)